MALHETKEAALLIWINSLNLEEPVDKISNLQDGRLLVKLIYKLKGQENESQLMLNQPVQGRLDFIANFLQSHCKYKPDQGAIVSWQNVLNGHNLEVELSKVVVLLLYYSNMCTSLQGFENLNYKTQAELASVLRFVLDNEDSLSLNDNLENFLKRKVKFALSSVSSLSSISDEDSPVFTRKRKPEVQFVDLQTVASSSVSSPIQDILKTPQFQLRKLRKQLAEERNMRDELELELANSNKIITERETQLSLLQQRVQRLMRQSNEQSQESNELEDLRIKNESLLKRLQDILKQCQDLKTNKGQMERKIDQLTEENGNLSFQMRDVLDRLTKAQAAVDKLSDEQEISVKEWESRRVSLESELNQAIADKEDLSEQILILQGKISLLEDQLSKAQSQHREEGEVMGDVLKMESLRQEVADLAVKVSQLEDVIARLEEEKSQTQMELNTERIKFENEKSHLDGVISGLQQTLSDLKCEKETLERTSREQQEQFTNQIETLNMEIAKLSDIVHQRELEVKEMEKQEQAARETINGLNKQVDDLGDALRLKEEEAVSNAQQWNLERQESSRRENSLQEASVTAARERDAALAEYHHFQKAKEEEIEQLGQQIITLEDHQRTHQSLISELREEKQVLEVKVTALEAAVTELRSKCQSLEFENEAERSSHIQTVESLTTRLQDTERTLHDYKGKLAHQSSIAEENNKLHHQLAALEETVVNLRAELEAERKRFEETRVTDLQRISQMGEEVQDLASKNQRMSAELELVQKELLKEKQGKLTAESSLENLREEGIVVTTKLTTERDQAYFVIKEKEQTIQKLNSEVGALEGKLALTEETKIQELAAKKEEIERLISKTEQSLLELETVKKAKENADVHLQSTIEEHQNQLSTLSQELNDVRATLKQKESKLEALQAELLLKQEELKTQQECILHLQKESLVLGELKKRLADEEQGTLIYKQEAEDKEKEVVHLKALLTAKENEIKSFLQSIQTGEERSSAIQALLEKREEEIKSLQSRVLELEQACAEQKQHISALEKELAEAQRLVVEKTSAFEAQTSQLLDQHQDRVVSLEQRLESSESICSEQKRQVDKLSKELEEVRSLFEIRETALKEERTSLLLEIEKQKRELDVLKLEEQQERDCLKNQVVATVEELQKLQAESLVASSLISEKDNELEDLKKELQDVNGKLQVLQYRDDERTKLTDAKEIQSKELENTIEQLRGDVLAASSLASEKQGTMESLEKELNSLKQDIEKQRERELLSCQAVAAEESKCRQLEATISQLRSEVNAASSLVSERELELTSLQEEIKKLKEQEDLRSQEAAKVKAQQKELQGTIERLQTEVQVATSCAAEKEQLARTLQNKIDALQQEMGEKDILRCRAVSEEESCRRVLEDKVTQLEAQVLKASSLASERELKLNALLSEIKEKDNLRSQAISTEEAQRNALEEKIEKLQSELLAATSLASEGQSAVAQLQAELKALKDTHMQLIEKDELRSKASACEEHEREQLQENIDKLQAEVLAASALAAEREQRADTFQKKLDALQQENEERDFLRCRAIAAEEAQRKELEETIVNLKNEMLSASSPSFQLENEKLVTEKEALRKELSKAEAELSDVRLELTKAQTLIAELLPAKRKCQQQQAELCLAQAKHQEELEQRERAVAALEDDLQQVKEELSTLRPLREMTSEQDRAIQKLQEENAAHKGQVCKLQQINSQLTSENLEICSESSLGARRFDAELAVERESHSFALEKVRTEYQKQIAALKEDVLEGKKRQDVLTEKYESIKKKVLSDRQKFQDERQKLVIQVDELMDRLATAKSEQNNVKEQNEELQKQTSELQEQLTHKDGALEHYKAQVEKAKTHYGAKKQQLQEATEQIQALEKKLEGSQQENNTLKAEQKQLVTELQQAQLSIKKLSSKVSSLQAQVDLADRQLREQKFQAGSNTTKNHVSECSEVPEKTQETSKDSLDLSLDDSLNSTRKPSTSTDKTTPPVRSSERLAAKRRLLSGESLETLYFTPMMVRAESKLESSIASLGELTLDSAKKSRSARRRTTQIINITLTKKTPGAPEPESVNSSFYSLQSAQSHPNLFTQTQKSRPVSMASLSSRLNASQEFLDNEISASESLFNLPGYRPGAASTVTARRSTNAFVAGAQNEPEHTEDWMRIAELQTRNKSCLPHLKSSYPLENRPSINIPSFCISDDDVKLGDPDETIRRASMLPGQLNETLASHRMSMLPGQMPAHRMTMLPGQISEGLSSHRASMLPQPSTQYSWRATGDVSQQLKRCSNVPQEGGDTPESKKMMTACFPRPMTPKDKNDRRFTVQNAQNRPPSCQDGRRESVMFSVANTPKKKGGSLLQRSMSKIRNSTRKSPGFASKTPRRSPRISSSKSPKNAASTKKMSRKPMKNMKI
ncbi:nuclear mitotic apparatus protein 1 isoform X3 [Lepisosteus oculatus]|uniref:nuclear mitotic apparatus protein 1 isoform X3 n=1 Tax=Lepisosteus oculatus TaxID=7918 RepID=UPI0037159E68